MIDQYRDLPEVVATPTVQRAVALHDCWDRITDRSDGRTISTAPVSLQKNRPSLLKVELEDELGEDLGWTQVYRAMRKLADLDDRYQYVERERKGLERRNEGTVREIHLAPKIAAGGGHS